MESSWSSSPERVEPRFGEGAPTPPRERPDPLARSLAEPRFEYAGFWQRAVALLIDWLIVVVIADSHLEIHSFRKLFPALGPRCVPAAARVSQDGAAGR